MPRELSKEEIRDIKIALPGDAAHYKSQQWHDKTVANLLYTLSLREREVERLRGAIDLAINRLNDDHVLRNKFRLGAVGSQDIQDALTVLIEVASPQKEDGK